MTRFYSTKDAGGLLLNPSSIPGLVGWWEADSLTGLVDGDAISSVSDLSGVGNTMAQATSGNKPIYAANAYNSLPAIRFGATNKYLSAAVVTTSIQFTMVLVATTGTNYDTKQFYNGNAGANGYGLLSSTGSPMREGSLFGGVSSNGYYTPPSTSGLNVFTLRRAASGTTTLYMNSVAAGTTSSTPNTPGTSTALGQAASGSYNGDIVAALIWNNAIDLTDLATIESQFRTKYGF